MKKLITIMLCAFLMSCEEINRVEEGEVVTLIGQNDSNSYYYLTKEGNYFYSKRLIYQVGDTLKFAK